MKRSIASVWVLLAVSAAVLAACSEPATPDPPTTLVAQALTDYNVRNNAAVDASQRYDGSLWKTADTGAVLAGDLFETRYREVFTVPAESYKLFNQPVQLYGAPPAAHPKWIIGTVEGRRDSPATPNAGASTPTSATAAPSTSEGPALSTEVAVFEQAAEGAPWLMSHSGSVNRADLPTDGAGSPATPAQQQAATALGHQLAEWLTSGTAPADVHWQTAAEFRARATQSTADVSRTLGCSVYSAPVGQSGVSEAVRVSRAGSASLVAISLSCVTQSSALAGGGRMTWNPGWDKLYPQPSWEPNLRQPWAAMLLVVDPDEGAPAVIGTRRANVL